MNQTMEKSLDLELTETELELVQAGLKLLLAIEDDHLTISELKVLLARIDREIAVALARAEIAG